MRNYELLIKDPETGQQFWMSENGTITPILEKQSWYEDPMIFREIIAGITIILVLIAIVLLGMSIPG